MGVKIQTGFTIIEVMLFLAVTGLLAVGILAGSGVAISQQRYRDSVNTLRSYIQQQYSEVANVVNSREKAWTCDTNGVVAPTDTGGGEFRGTSGCVILGRYINIDATGTKLTTSNVTGYRTPGVAAGESDITEVNNYKLGISTVDQDSSEVNWGAQVVKQKSTNPMPLSILIIRSPLSGSILTFTAEGPQPTSLNTLVTLANTSVARDLCVNADAGVFASKRMEVRIAAYAASQTAIQVPIESDSVCN
jgi:type II secretory pathway pseudopilin PulG